MLHSLVEHTFQQHTSTSEEGAGVGEGDRGGKVKLCMIFSI